MVDDDEPATDGSRGSGDDVNIPLSDDPLLDLLDALVNDRGKVAATEALGGELTHDSGLASAAPVVQRDGGVEAAPAVELHSGPASVRAGGHGGGEAVDSGHSVHPADEQGQPFPGCGVGPHEVRGSVEAEHPGGLSDAVGRQVAPLAGRQVDGAVVDAPDDAFGQQVGQGAVYGRVRLAESERQLHRVDEGHPAEGIEQVSV